MSSFDIPINLDRLKKYHPYADALSKLKTVNTFAYQFTVLTKYNTHEETEAFINRYTDLLTAYGIEEDSIANELLFFSTLIYEEIGKLDAQFKDLAIAKTTLKSLIDLLRIKDENKADNVKIEVKPSIGDKAVIVGASFINEFSTIMITSLTKTVYSPTYNERLAKLLDSIEPNYESLLRVYNDLQLTKRRPYNQAISYNSNLILNYLENETSLKKGEAKVISDRQCQFLYVYLNLFELVDDDNVTSLPKDYIRSMIESFDFKYF